MRQRRRRTAFSEEQLDRLEESFMEEKFPGIIIREQLAEELNIKEDRIQVGSGIFLMLGCEQTTQWNFWLKKRMTITPGFKPFK